VLAQRLQRFEPFAAADAAERAMIARHTRVLELPAGRSFVAGSRRPPGSWYLARGSVRLLANDGTVARVAHDTAAARRALVDGASHKVRAAVTLTASELLYVDLTPISFLLEQRALPRYAVDEVCSRDGHWAHRFLAGGVARRLSPSLLQTLFRSFVRTDVDAGTRIVRRGDTADAFYVLREGTARVVHESGMVDLLAGASFGADALVTRHVRNASVCMLEDGVVMKLAAHRFHELIEAPLIERVDHAPRGSLLLDVDRLPKSGVELRGSLIRLDASRTYTVVGRDERQVRLVVYLLRERGVEALCLA
jgi:signal-transduction protein with cAMP-binding, CBS, and nucleotidyltransferase domain